MQLTQNKWREGGGTRKGVDIVGGEGGTGEASSDYIHSVYMSTPHRNAVSHGGSRQALLPRGNEGTTVELLEFETSSSPAGMPKYALKTCRFVLRKLTTS